MKLRPTPAHVTVAFSRRDRIYTVIAASGSRIPKVGHVLTGAEVQQLIDGGVRISIR